MKNMLEEYNNLVVIFDYMEFEDSYEEKHNEHLFNNFYAFPIKKQITNDVRYIKDIFGNFELIKFVGNVPLCTEVNEVVEHLDDALELYLESLNPDIDFGKYDWFNIYRKLDHEFDADLKNIKNDIKLKITAYTSKKSEVLYNDISTEYLKYDSDGRYIGKENTTGYNKDIEYSDDKIVEKEYGQVVKTQYFSDDKIETIENDGLTYIWNNSDDGLESELEVLDKHEVINGINLKFNDDGHVIEESTEDFKISYNIKDELVSNISRIDSDSETFDIEYDSEGCLKMVKSSNGFIGNYKFKNGILVSYKDNYGCKFKNPFVK